MKKIIIDGNEFLTVEDAAQFICDNLDDNDYDDDLDSCYDEIKIGCCTFYPSEVLKECDPIAYRCGFDDFQNSVYEDALYYLEEEEEEIRGYKVEYIEEEEDE